MSYTILQGDCLETMRTLPDCSVQCVVTSPPYFGLRDYQTATWEGGDSGCDHKPLVKPRSTRARNGLTGGIEYMSAQEPVYGALCGKCGARRIDSQIGLEDTPDAYVAKLVDVFREVRRVLRDDGIVFLNLGDSYNGSGSTGSLNGIQGTNEGSHKKQSTNVSGLKPKDLIGIPWMVAFALRADGWWLRSEIIWHKRVPMPESVRDRPTKAHEQVFLLAKSAKYYYDQDAIREPQLQSSLERLRRGWNGDKKRGWPGTARNNFDRYMGKTEAEIEALKGANKRSVWSLNPEPSGISHFAVMPTKLVEPCILAGSKVGDTVLDPFAGSGTT